MIRIFIYFLLLLVLHGCSSVPVVPQATGIPLQDICEHYQVSWQWDPVSQVVLLAYKGNKAKLLIDSPTVLLGHQKITLSGPIYRQQSTVYVPQDFESKVMGPFIMKLAGLSSIEDFSRVHVVIIDPGHGGKDHGTIYPGSMTEKEIVLDVAHRLQGFLEGAGIKVIMTRQGDDFISLPERTMIASRSPADLFVSIHVNSNQDRDVKGLLVYYIGSLDQRHLYEEQRRDNERLLAKQLNPQPPGSLQHIVGDMMQVVKTSQSQKLAHMIVQEARQEGDVWVRGDGMRLCHFYVVRNTLIPAVLVETGFLSDRQERHKLITAEYRQKLAQVIARGILDYANE